MILLARNAVLTDVSSPAVPADPKKNITGSAKSSRWSGNIDAYIDEDAANRVHNQSLIAQSSATGGLESTGNTVVHLPANLPVWPNLEDLITLKRLPVMNPSPTASSQIGTTQTFKVRMVDTGLLQQGRLMIHCVLS